MAHLGAAMKRACIEPGCPRLTTGTRCTGHTKARDAARQLRRGDFYTAHNYRARRARCIALTPYCIQCGATSDLTADHVVSGDPMSPLRTLCRSCNSARANRSRVGGR